MAQTVVGLFENDSDAQRAAEQLQQAGIDRSNVDIARGGTGTSNVSTSGESEGGMARFFKNLFGDSDDADRYSRVSTSGATSIVTVHAQSADQAQRAAEILDSCGAIDVDERSLQNTGRESYVANTGGTDERGTTIPRIREELQVGKREVESGGVRLRSRIVEKPVEESIRLREEHVSVQRQAVDRPLTDADRTAFQDRDIELTERAEVPVVAKEARVVEEVTLSKDVTERNETIRDTVRNTEVDVDRIDETGTRSGLEERGTL